jgi:hypothetical protein
MSASGPGPALPEEDLRALGWLTPAQFGALARQVAIRDIVDPLATIGMTISTEDRAELFAIATTPSA